MAAMNTHSVRAGRLKAHRKAQAQIPQPKCFKLKAQAQIPQPKS